MSKDAPANPKWSPGAWTPKRCAVWKIMAEEARVGFVAWVAAEATEGMTYPSQLLPEHEALLSAA